MSEIFTQTDRKRLAGVHPTLIDRMRTVFEQVQAAGEDMIVVRGLSSWNEQAALYAKGRSIPPLGKAFVVTNAPPGHSWHNFGLAVDAVPHSVLEFRDWKPAHPAWALYGQALHDVGLEWGGNWSGNLVDKPHAQMNGDLSLSRANILFTGSNDLTKVWQAVVIPVIVNV